MTVRNLVLTGDALKRMSFGHCRIYWFFRYVLKNTNNSTSDHVVILKMRARGRKKIRVQSGIISKILGAWCRMVHAVAKPGTVARGVGFV